MNHAPCIECYAHSSRITPLLNPRDCLENHTQYICGTCGRCICIASDPKRGVQRWHFPFQSLEIAKLYLRTADYTMKKPCGIYALVGKGGRVSYKIFPDAAHLALYLEKNKDKACPAMAPVFTAGPYTEYPHTQVRRLTPEEAALYLRQQSDAK